MPHPNESYALLGEIRATVDHLNQVVGQLASWHQNVVDGKHYDGIDKDGYLTPESEISDDRRARFVKLDVAVLLETAADELRLAASSLG